MIKREYIYAVIITTVALVFSNAYVLFGFMLPKEGMEFLGRRVTNSQDTYTYIAFIEQAKQGKILFENLYSNEAQTQSLVRPLFAFLGILSSIFNISSLSAYHIGRVIFSVLFCITLFVFLGYFFKTEKRRLFAYSIVLFSSGLGFILGGFWPNSTDLWIPESITFQSLQESPHFVFSQTLMMFSFMLVVLGWRKKQVKYLLFSALPLIVLGFEHPYNLSVSVLTVVAAGVYLAVRHKITRKMAVFGICSVFVGAVLGSLYQVFELINNPILRSWAHDSSSPIPLYYILGFGLLLVLAGIGIEKYIKEQRVEQVLLLSWVAVSSVLLYAPVYFQRRLSEGMHIPLSILAAEGGIVLCLFASSFVLHKIRKVVAGVLAAILLLLVSLGSITSVTSETSTISNDYQGSYYYYLLNQEVEAMEYIKKNAHTNDIVLSNWFYGNILPGLSGRKVFLGHKVQTKNFDIKVEEVNKFLLNKDTNESYGFLKENGITYVFVGKNDTMLKYGFKPAEKPYLEKVFDQGEAKVYRVK